MKQKDITKSFRLNLSDYTTWLKFKSKVYSESKTIKSVIIELIEKYVRGEM